MDRVAADGQLTGWQPTVGLDATYRLGGFLTHRLLRADPRKIVLAHSDAALALGSHRSGAWKEETPAIRDEAARLLAHLDANDGRIDTANPLMDWRPISLTVLPSWWPELATRVIAEFRPPAGAARP
ncbi:hypothetical protein LO762_09615 [Actinocorallia sp. API 0066]|uniref:hypothetical protein n=1 Tax=Actinocorallia sp. API 0066 TaxID=2896846 RepID=UPI001E31F610|nr:hypothetical protein [Actinocorallia sp. API 0066]MCD0449445.1 hypothetical protein [Actinocorallia sp. API 0066]